jgi:hypothetical protein
MSPTGDERLLPREAGRPVEFIQHHPNPPTSSRWSFNYSPDWLDRLNVYFKTNLAAGNWQKQVENLDPVGSNSLVWTDHTVSAQSMGFYFIGNADLDSDDDALTDARELFLHDTCTTNADTDGDGLIDGYEMNVTGTNPTAESWDDLPGYLAITAMRQLADSSLFGHAATRILRKFIQIAQKVCSQILFLDSPFRGDPGGRLPGPSFPPMY